MQVIVITHKAKTLSLHSYIGRRSPAPSLLQTKASSSRNALSKPLANSIKGCPYLPALVPSLSSHELNGALSKLSAEDSKARLAAAGVGKQSAGGKAVGILKDYQEKIALQEALSDVESVHRGYGATPLSIHTSIHYTKELQIENNKLL